MRYNITLLFLVINFFVFSQPKNYKKLESAFDAKQYDKCIILAKKYINKKPNDLMPVYYCSKSYYEQFKNDSASNNLKNSLKYMYKILKIDKEKNNKDIYSELNKELKSTTYKYANELYNKDKNKSELYYNYIAKIYNDTLKQYYDFHPELKKNKTQEPGLKIAKDSVNVIDKNGKKQGLWTKKYKSGVVAYKVYFKDDRPIGTHKRFHPNGKLMAIIVFDDNSEGADAQLFDENESLIAKGKYIKQKKHGLWKLYRDSVLIGEENYKEGKKHGVSKTYYFDTGKVSEETNWENGIEHGIWKQFYHNGKQRLETKIENGKRNSAYIKYHDNGIIETKGAYKQDVMEGKWYYYDREGKQVDVITYTNGKADKQDEIDKKKAEILKKLKQNKGRFVDPAKYKNDPNEYFKKIK